MRAFLLAALLALAPAQARAEAPPGGDDPALEAAIALWLDGDDAGSLPAMARLARDDNLAAQILIDRIRTRGLATTPWVAALPQDDQRALFRRMDTRLGTTWMRVAAERSPMAALFISYLQPGPDGFSADDALALAAMGEAGAGAELLVLMMSHGRWREAARLGPVGEATGLAPLVWAAATHAPDEPDAAALIEAGLAAADRRSMEGLVFLRHADPAHPATAALSESDHVFIRYSVEGAPPVVNMGPPTPEVGAFLGGWLATDPAAAPIRRYCAERCPDAAAACAEDVWGALDGYLRYALLRPSPLESLIPTERFLASRRAGLALDAAITAAMREPDGSWHPTVALESCLRTHLDGR